jgi:hypothetical protein
MSVVIYEGLLRSKILLQFIDKNTRRSFKKQNTFTVLLIKTHEHLSYNKENCYSSGKTPTFKAATSYATPCSY